MDTKTCIETRRSIRKFKSQPVSRQLLEQAVKMASYAPSWKNTQISRYIAIEDEQVRREIGERYASFNRSIIEHCAVLIAQTFVISRSGFERDGSYSTDRKEGWQYYDCGIAAQTFCLAAHELGLGTVILGIFDRKGLEQYLEIPEEQELMALIAVGYPEETSVPAPKRKGVEELLQYQNER